MAILKWGTPGYRWGSPIGPIPSDTGLQQYDPTTPISSAFRALHDYVSVKMPVYASDFADPDLRSKRIYDLVMEFPGASVLKYMPLPRTLIHFALDDMESPRVGFGSESIIDLYDEDTGIIRGYEPTWDVLNFDVGVWATDRSGGVSSRLEAIEYLRELFNSNSARIQLFQETGGVNVTRWSGGRNAQDTINDIDVYRYVGATLEIRLGGLSAPLDSHAVTGFVVEQEYEVGEAVITAQDEIVLDYE